MPHHRTDPTTTSDVLEHLPEQGLEGMARAIEILLNEAMKIEHPEYQQAGQYQCIEDRLGYANGFKPKSIKSRVVQLGLAVPKARDMGAA